MILRIITDEGAAVEVGELDAPDLFAAFAYWRLSIPRSLREIRRWDAVLGEASRYLLQNDLDGSVDSVEVVR